MKLAVSLTVLLAADPAFAQDGHSAASAHRPYADLTVRAVKALSPEETDALLSGKGFSQALAAELNGYPGPRHVLDLDRDLALTDRQRADVEALFAEMQREAVALGREIVQAEAASTRPSRAAPSTRRRSPR